MVYYRIGCKWVELLWKWLLGGEIIFRGFSWSCYGSGCSVDREYGLSVVGVGYEGC